MIAGFCRVLHCCFSQKHMIYQVLQLKYVNYIHIKLAEQFSWGIARRQNFYLFPDFRHFLLQMRSFG